VSVALRMHEFLLTTHNSSANAIDCNATALSVWLGGTSYVPANIAVDGFGACRVIYSVFEVMAGRRV